jgi:hypothetical protein
MKFFVPLVREESQLFWNVVHSGLFCRYRFATPRRIQALLWEGDAADPRSVIVGEDLPGGARGDPVMVIHESEFFPGMMMFVCTLGMFLEREPPVALALTEHMRVVEFESGNGETGEKNWMPRPGGR